MSLYFEEGYIHSYEKKLYEANRKYWDAVPNTMDGEKWIYVYHSLPIEFDMCLLEDLAAKGLQNKVSLPIISVTYGKSPTIDEMDASFGIQEIHHLIHRAPVDLLSRLRTFAAAKFASRYSYKKEKRLFAIRYRGVPCGDEIHDTIIRKNSIRTEGQQFECFDISQKEYFQYVWQAFSTIDRSISLFKRRKPAYVISTECIYIKGLFGRVASLFGARRWTTSLETADIIAQSPPGTYMLHSEILRRKIEVHMEKNPLLEPETDNLFVMKTESGTRNDLLKRLGILNDKKNVFIMLHCLTDLPRGNRQHIYGGYNEWFLDTLRMIRDIKNVNWIIKDHPMSSYFAQDHYVKSVFEKYKTEAMFWCDKSVSGMEIKEIADCVVTCAGEVALEYWAYGIPTITTAEGYFCGWGISYCMRSREEYEAALRNLDRLEPPSPQSSLQAKRYLSAIQDMGSTEDALASLFVNERRKIIAAYKRANYSTDMWRYGLCKGYIDLLKGKGVRSSSIYQLEKLYEM